MAMGLRAYASENAYYTMPRLVLKQYSASQRQFVPQAETIL